VLITALNLYPKVVADHHIIDTLLQ